MPNPNLTTTISVEDKEYDLSTMGSTCLELKSGTSIHSLTISNGQNNDPFELHVGLTMDREVIIKPKLTAVWPCFININKKLTFEGGVDLHLIRSMYSWKLGSSLHVNQAGIVLPDKVSVSNCTNTDAKNISAIIKYRTRYFDINNATKQIVVISRTDYDQTNILNDVSPEPIENTLGLDDIAKCYDLNKNDYTLAIHKQENFVDYTLRKDPLEKTSLLVNLETTPKVGIKLEKGINLAYPVRILIRIE